MPTVIQRYLIREILSAWAAVTVVLLLVMVTSLIGRFLADIAAGDLPSNLLFTLLALKMVRTLGLLLPASLFLGAMLALGRLYRDSEMVVMSACGIGPTRLYRALAWLGVPSTVLLAVVCLWLAPQAAATGQAMKDEATRNAQVSTLLPGRFQTLSGGKVVYVGDRSGDGDRFQRVLIIDDQKGQVDVMSAGSGRYYEDRDTGGRYLVLEDGQRVIGVPGHADFQLLRFGRNTIKLPRSSGDTTTPELEARSSLELLKSGRPFATAELQWRIAQPLTVIVLILLVVPASRVAPREGRYSKLVLGLLIYMAYVNLLGLARVWIEQGQVPTWLGLWWVHAMFAALAVGWAVALYRRRRAPVESPA